MLKTFVSFCLHTILTTKKIVFKSELSPLVSITFYVSIPQTKSIIDQFYWIFTIQFERLNFK